MQHSSAEIARLLLESSAVVLSPERPFKFASGILSPIYCDNRLLMGKLGARRIIVETFSQYINDEILSAEIIAGTATAGVPWAAWIAHELNLPMAYVRSGAKKYGRGQQVEGGVQAGQRVVVVEDLVSTGGSALDAVAGLRNMGAHVSHCCAIFSYAMQAAVNGFSSAGVELVTLTTLPILLEEATQTNYIREDQRALIADWAVDPSGWAERAGVTRVD